MTADLAPLELVVLTRLHTSGRKPPSLAELGKSLERFSVTRVGPDVSDAWARLERAGLIDETRQTTSDVAKRLASQLGGQVTNWKTAVANLLPAVALGLAAGDDGRACTKTRETLAPALVARSLGWWRRGRPPTMAALGDRLVWEGLQLRSHPKRVPPEIRAIYACRLLGKEGLAFDRAVYQLAAQAVGAKRADLVALRDAMIGRWLSLEVVTGELSPDVVAVPSSIEPAPPRAVDLAAFAEAVRGNVAGAAEGRFSDDRVFIAAVWRQMRGRPPVGDVPLEIFKEWLVAAHRAGLLILHRADLVGVMDPAEVERSETRTAGARYHFVEREARP